jgi:hypothetical protein
MQSDTSPNIRVKQATTNHIFKSEGPSFRELRSYIRGLSVLFMKICPRTACSADIKLDRLRYCGNYRIKLEYNDANQVWKVLA